MVSSSKSFVTSTEVRSTEQSDPNIVHETQLDRVSSVREPSAAHVDAAATVQKPTPLVRSGHAGRSIAPRRAATIGPPTSVSYKAPEARRARAPTMYSAVGVERYRPVGRYMM